MNIVPNVFAFIALTTWVTSFQFKEKPKILLFQLFANIFYAIQYLLLGLFSAGFMNIVSAIRCYIFRRNCNKDKDTSFVTLFFFLFAILVIALIYCKTFLDVLPIIAAILFTVSSWQENTNLIRFCCMLAAFIFVIYNFTVGAYISLIGNMFEVSSAIIAIVRFRSKKPK